MQIHIEDKRLRPILEKVQADVRLDAEDGVALFKSSDILAVGYMANLVRERKHGNVTWFNVNRHINPTDVCVASCKLCAFGKRAKDPKAYTWSLDEVWHRAGEGWSEAVTEFHIVGGLHPELTLDWYCDMLRGLKQRFPEVHLKALHHGGGRLSGAAQQAVDPGDANEVDRCRRGFAAGRRRGDFQRSRAAHHLRSQDRRKPVAGSRADRAPARVEIQLHHAVRPHRDRRGSRGSPGETARALQDETDGFQTFIPLAFHPANTALEHIPTTTGFLDLKMIAVSRLMLDNISHIKAYWIMMTPAHRADRAAFRRR